MLFKLLEYERKIIYNETKRNEMIFGIWEGGIAFDERWGQACTGKIFFRQ